MNDHHNQILGFLNKAEISKREKMILVLLFNIRYGEEEGKDLKRRLLL